MGLKGHVQQKEARNDVLGFYGTVLRKPGWYLVKAVCDLLL